MPAPTEKELEMSTGDALSARYARSERRRRRPAAARGWDELTRGERVRVNVYCLLAILVVAFLALVGLAAALGA